MFQLRFLLFGFALIAAVTQTTGAQSLVDSLTAESTATPGQIRTLLESSALRDQAWGGWLAGRTKLPEMVPLLERVVTQRFEDKTDASNAALDTALDALIQTDARMSPEWLLTVFARRPAQALVLLSRLGPAANSVLLRIAEDGRSIAWFAASNLLIAQRAPGLGAMLLRDYELNVTIKVLDPGQRESSTYRVGDRLSRTDLEKPLSGFPPWPTYLMFGPDFAPGLSAGPAAVVLSAGPTPVYYRRDVFAFGDPPPPQAVQWVFGPTADDRLRYVAAAAPSWPRLPVVHQHSVVWSDSEAFDREVRRIMQATRELYKGVLKELEGFGYMSAEEVARFSETKLNVTFDDRRSVRTLSLKLPQ